MTPFEIAGLVLAVAAAAYGLYRKRRPMHVRPTCEGCEQEIDPDCCWCGSDEQSHNGYYDNHPFIPMGCDCHRVEAYIPPQASGPKVQCLACGDVIQSTHRHDFVWCGCGETAVDGGSDYLRVVGEGKALDVG